MYKVRAFGFVTVEIGVSKKA